MREWSMVFFFQSWMDGSIISCEKVNFTILLVNRLVLNQANTIWKNTSQKNAVWKAVDVHDLLDFIINAWIYGWVGILKSQTKRRDRWDGQSSISHLIGWQLIWKLLKHVVETVKHIESCAFSDLINIYLFLSVCIITCQVHCGQSISTKKLLVIITFVCICVPFCVIANHLIKWLWVAVDWENKRESKTTKKGEDLNLKFSTDINQNLNQRPVLFAQKPERVSYKQNDRHFQAKTEAPSTFFTIQCMTWKNKLTKMRKKNV